MRNMLANFLKHGKLYIFREKKIQRKRTEACAMKSIFYLHLKKKQHPGESVLNLFNIGEHHMAKTKLMMQKLQIIK